MDEDLKLYIPLGVKPEAELFTGFGKKQFFQALIGSLVMGGAAALVWLFTANVTTTVVLALTGIFGSVMMTTKDQFVRGGSGAEPGPVPERAENLPVPLRGRMGA
jgi:hypothetical protein